MSNIQEKKFDYSLVDTDTAEFLKSKESNIKRSVGRAAYEIGKELKEAKEKLGDDYSLKIFKKWCESLGIHRATGDRYIRYYKGFKKSSLEHNALERLPKTIVESLGSDQTPNELKEKIENGEIKTQQEMQDLRKKLNAERKEKERMEKQLKAQIEKLKNADPEKEIVEIEKEVIPDDYEEMKKTLETIERKKNELEEENKELGEIVGDINTANSEVREALKRKKSIDEEINDLIEYQQALEDQNNVMKHRAEIVQGVKKAVKKSMQTKPDVEMLLDREVEMTESDLEEIEYEAEQLAKYAKQIFRYVAKKRNNQNFKEGDVIDVN